MNRKKILFSVVLLWLWIPVIGATDSLFGQLYTLIMRQDYAFGRHLLDSLQRGDPQNIALHYYRIYLEQIEIVDYESYVVDGDTYVERALGALEKIERYQGAKGASDERVRQLFYRATVHSTLALILAKQERWMRALGHGRESIKLLEKIQRADTTFYDVLYFLGTFKYYMGKSLGWLTLWGDGTAQGIAQINQAMERGIYFSDAAAISLAWIFIERGEYGRAQKVVDTLNGRYPENTMILRVNARLKLHQQEHRLARDCAKSLIARSWSRDRVNWSDLLSGHQILVASLDATGERKRCLEEIERVMQLQIPPEAQRLTYVKKHLGYIIAKNEEIKRSSLPLRH